MLSNQSGDTSPGNQSTPEGNSFQNKTENAHYLTENFISGIFPLDRKIYHEYILDSVTFNFLKENRAPTVFMYGCNQRSCVAMPL